MAGENDIITHRFIKIREERPGKYVIEPTT
jgi:hypothetical protein